MNSASLSLTHRFRRAEENDSIRPPLLLLLHGIGSNENDLFALVPYMDERYFIVSARAPLVMGRDSYAWFNIGFTQQGLVADLA